MSLVKFVCDISRDTVTADAYGGETAVAANIYTGRSATFNYYTSRAQDRFESTTQIRGPGVQTRTRGVVIFDPKPDSMSILINDRVVASPAVTGVPSSLAVIGVRTYEKTLQLDVEALA